MLSFEYTEFFLSYPIKIDFCFPQVVTGFDNFIVYILEKHNKKYSTEIDYIYINQIPGLDDGDFKVYIGKELVYFGKIPSRFVDNYGASFKDFSTEDEVENFFIHLDAILETWHDKIVESQLFFKQELETLKAEEQYAILVSFYNQYDIRNKDFMFCLKQLALKYPYSEYNDILSGIYIYGNRQEKKISMKLQREDRQYKHSF